MYEKESGRNFPADPDAVFHALHTHATDSLHVLNVDEEVRTVKFQTKRSLFSWGHVVVAHVLDEPTGTRIELVVTGLPEAPRALMDGKKNASMAERILDDIQSRLPR